jgi:hypothetical protein
LILKIPLRDDFGGFNEAVRQCGLAMINMGNDTEVSDILHNFDFNRPVGEKYFPFYPVYSSPELSKVS